MGYTIIENGNEIDLTKICSPYGLQSLAVQDALRSVDVQVFSAGSGWVTAPVGHRNYAMTYRRKPEGQA